MREYRACADGVDDEGGDPTTNPSDFKGLTQCCTAVGREV